MARTRHWLELGIIVGAIALGAAFMRPEPPPPTDELYELAEGMRLTKTGRYADAIPPLTAALKRQPESIQALVYRGRCEFALGQKDAARKDLDEAVRVSSPLAVQLLYPRPAISARLERGRQAMLELRYDEALTDARAALTSLGALGVLDVRIFDPQQSDAHTIKGVALAAQGYYGQARDEFYDSLVFADTERMQLGYRHLAGLSKLQGQGEDGSYYQDQAKDSGGDGCHLCRKLGKGNR